MKRGSWSGWALAVGLGVAGLVQATPADVPVGRWRFSRAMGLDGAEGSRRDPVVKAWIGRALDISPGALRGPRPFDARSGCGRGARWVTFADVPAQGLFEGHFQDLPPAEAEERVRRLGVRALPATVHRITCSNAGFDFVQVDSQTLLLAIDGQVWTLSNNSGTAARPGSPEVVVQTFPEAPFQGDRGLTPGSAAVSRLWLSGSLRNATHAYFDRSRPSGEVRPIDGDPFTTNREPPTRFALQAAVVSGAGAEAAVRFADGWREESLAYRPVREGRAWRIDDVLPTAAGAQSLRSVLEHAP